MLASRTMAGTALGGRRPGIMSSVLTMLVVSSGISAVGLIARSVGAQLDVVNPSTGVSQLLRRWGHGSPSSIYQASHGGAGQPQAEGAGGGELAPAAEIQTLKAASQQLQKQGLREEATVLLQKASANEIERRHAKPFWQSVQQAAGQLQGVRGKLAGESIKRKKL